MIKGLKWIKLTAKYLIVRLFSLQIPLEVALSDGEDVPDVYVIHYLHAA